MSQAPAPLRVVIVDDEAPARARLRALLAREPDIAIAGECSDGPSAIEAVRASKPDLVFLDVQMPEMDGFQVLRELGADPPGVVFVTAYDRYALRAFDAAAVDYLLKPFTNARFRDALDRARQAISARHDRTLRRRLEALLAETRTGAAAPPPGGGQSTTHAAQHVPEPGSEPAGLGRRIAVRGDDRIQFIEPGEIDWIEGAGNYVRLHAGGRQHLVRETLKAMARRLDPDRFLRIHNSHIVNLDRVRELRPWGHGEYIVVLQDGTRLASSRSYSADLRRLID